jgi:cobalt/nickel transport system ATP-binding protein
MSHHIIEASQLSYRYPDTTPALEDISFTILHGESVGLVGANGAGKSTLLQHLCGCLFPTSGEVRIGHVPITKKNLQTVRKRIGMVFQDPDDQLFMPRVFDDVAFGPLNLGVPPEEVEQRVMAALEEVGAEHLADRPPYKISGGEKRSVAIATVLSMSPDILLLDEPSSGLDPKSRRQLIRNLHGFSHTKIIATHDLDLVLDLCSRTIILNHGSITADGPTREIFSNEALLQENNLEKPLTMQG